jgi:hypothetical protein
MRETWPGLEGNDEGQERLVVAHITNQMYWTRGHDGRVCPRLCTMPATTIHDTHDASKFVHATVPCKASLADGRKAKKAWWLPALIRSRSEKSACGCFVFGMPNKQSVSACRIGADALMTRFRSTLHWRTRIVAQAAKNGLTLTTTVTMNGIVGRVGVGCPSWGASGGGNRLTTWTYLLPTPVDEWVWGQEGASSWRRPNRRLAAGGWRRGDFAAFIMARCFCAREQSVVGVVAA